MGLIDQIITVAGWVCAPICSALVVALQGQRRRTREERERAEKAEAERNAERAELERARIIIEKASARAHVKHAYERYVINGEHMTIAAYEELLEEYEAYTILGGNGTAKSYMAEILKLKPYLVTD